MRLLCCACSIKENLVNSLKIICPNTRQLKLKVTMQLYAPWYVFISLMIILLISQLLQLISELTFTAVCTFRMPEYKNAQEKVVGFIVPPSG